MVKADVVGRKLRETFDGMWMIGKLAPSEAFAEDQGVNTTDSDESASRYSRQVLFPAIGEVGQARILASTVTVVGCGALGASQGELLARAGVGRIRLIDRDIVERSNLGRQALYRESDALERRPKAVALAAHLREFNREIEVLPQVAHLAAANVDDLLMGSDVILDGSDNFDVRYLINDWAVRESVPWVYGACVAARGLSAVILPGRSPCLRCLFPDPPPKGASQTCDTAGIIAPAATIIASLQVAEVLKILVGADAAIRRSLLSVDLWPFRIFEMGGPNSAPATDCPCCGRREFTFLSQEQGARALVPCGRDAVFIVPGRGDASFDFQAAVARLRPQFSLREGEGVAHWVLTEGTITLFEDGRALISGLSDQARALAIYDRYIGG